MARARKSRKSAAITLDNAWVVEYRTDPPGVLRVGPASVQVAVFFDVKHRCEDNWYSTVACRVRLADSEGRLWECESIFNPGVLMAKLIDVSRREPARWLENAPPEWRQALAERTLVRNVTDTHDDRFHRWFYLDHTAFYLRFKYLGVSYDIAHLEGSTLLVKASGLFGSWNPLPVEGRDGMPLPAPEAKPEGAEEKDEEEDEEEEDGGDYDNLDPLVYPLDCRELLFHDSAYQDSEDPQSGWNEGLFVRPPLFYRVKGEGDPQPAVTFRALATRKRSKPSKVGMGFWQQKEPTRLLPDGFVRLGLDNDCPVEFATSADGLLRLERGRVHLDLRLDLAPGSAREPVDVVRCRLRLADATGRRWEAVSHFTPEVFLENLIDLNAGDEPAYADPAEKEKALAERGLLTGVRGLLDDGVWRRFFVGETLLALPGVGQRPRFDVALGEEGLLVFLSGLVGFRHRVEVSSEAQYIALLPRQKGEETGPVEEEIPPLVFGGVPLFRNTTFAVDDGFWHRNPLPIPLVFSPAEGSDEAQPTVTFLPD